MGKALEIMGLLSQVYLTIDLIDSRLIEWFLHADTGGIIFDLTTNLFCIFDMFEDHCSCM